MKWISRTFFVIGLIIFFLALTSSFTIILILINKKVIIDNSNIDFFDNILRASFALIGSTLSGFVAILIYILQTRKARIEKENLQSDYLSKLTNEYSRNKTTIAHILDIYKDVSTEDIAEILLKPGNTVKELLLIYYTKLDFTVYQASLKELSEDSYINNIENWQRLFLISKYLNLLLNEVNNKKNIVILLNQIKQEIKSILD